MKNGGQQMNTMKGTQRTVELEKSSLGESHMQVFIGQILPVFLLEVK